MPRAALLLVVLLLGTAAAAAAAPLAPLRASAAYEVQAGAHQGQPPQAMLAPNTALAGLPLATDDAPTAENCTQQCMQDTDCAWFNWCPGSIDQVRVLKGGGAPLLAAAQRRTLTTADR